MPELNDYFDHAYPYGDLHELNLDWIIDVAKKTADTEAGLDGRVTNLEEHIETVDGEIESINEELLGVGNNIAGLEASIAVPFSDMLTYAVGDRVMHDCHLYRCEIAVETPGEWVGENWELVSVDGLLNSLDESKQDALTFDQTPTEDSTNPVTSGGVYAEDEKLAGSIAEPYSELTTYSVGDSVMYNNELRVCAQAVTIPEEFDETKWGYNRVMYSVQALSGQIGMTNGRVASLETWTSAATKTVTGNPITINDGSALPAKSLSVTFEPKQDLHGYDKPWAGGAGKNKLPLVLADIKSDNTSGTWTGNSYVINGVTFDLLTDGDENIIGITANGENTGIGNASLYLCTVQTLNSLLDGSYVFSGCPNDGSVSTYMMFIGSSLFNTGNDVNFSTPIAGSRCGISIYQGYNAQNLMFYPMIRLATETDATFEPYTNVCPPTGLTEASVEVTGKNLFGYGKSVEDVTTEYRENPTQRATTVKNNDNSITISPTGGTCSTSVYAIEGIDGTLPYTITYKITKNTTSFSPIMGIDPNNQSKERLLIYAGFNNNTSLNSSEEVTFSEIQVEYGSTPTAYTPYVTPHTATIALGDTIYGGTVDFETGKVRVTKGSGKVTSLIRNSAQAYYQGLSPSARGDQTTTAEVICDRLPTGNVPGVNQIFINSSGYVRVNTSIAFDTAQEAIDYLGGEFTVVYDLAEPFELTLTPAELELLKSSNTITANGATITLEYLPNTLLSAAEIESRKYTDEKIAMVLPTAPTTDGTYVLTCTVDDGEASLSWVAQS